MAKRSPVETKVVAATGSAAAGTATSAFVVWLLGVLVWGAPSDSGHADQAVLAVPTPVSVLVALALTSGITWAGGYLARHTPRDDAGHANSAAVWIIAGALVVIALVGLFGRP